MRSASSRGPRIWDLEPLIEFCERVWRPEPVDDVSRPGGASSGDCAGWAHKTAAVTGVKRTTLVSWRSKGWKLTDMQADEIATSMGLHPCELWPDWFTVGLFDETEVLQAAV